MATPALCCGTKHHNLTLNFGSVAWSAVNIDSEACLEDDPIMFDDVLYA